MRGFLITCNNREREAVSLGPFSQLHLTVKGLFTLLLAKTARQVREAYNLFNEISDQLYGPENCKDNSGENQKTEDVTGEEEEEDEDEDIDAAFEKEKTELTEMGKKTASGERRFQV